MVTETPEAKSDRNDIPKKTILPATTKEKITIIRDRLARLYNGALTTEELSRKVVDERLLQYYLKDTGIPSL